MMDAKSATISLSGKWYGYYGQAPCPICQPERKMGQNALSLSNGSSRLLAHCKKSDCRFQDIIGALGQSSQKFLPSSANFVVKHDQRCKNDQAKKFRQARAIWEAARPISGTLAEIYLVGRAISCKLGPNLRFLPNAWHGATGRRFPALIAKIEGAAGFGIHRTYLSNSGRGKADIAPSKAMLGFSAGGVVRLRSRAMPLMVTEGIETGLSLACNRQNEQVSIWASLSTSGMRTLNLPTSPGQLIIAPDGDQPGQAAAFSLADRAHLLGWEVSMLTPPSGCDWNDVLMMNRGKK